MQEAMECNEIITINSDEDDSESQLPNNSTLENFRRENVHEDPLMLPADLFSDNVLQDEISEDGCTETEYRCDICEKVFSSEVNVKRHFTLLHRELTKELKGKAAKNPREKFICEFCMKTFLYKNSLRRHQIRTCHKAAAHRNANNFQHKKSNSNIVYICSKCGKIFQQKKFLTRHELVHTGQKDHICEICNKEFATIKSLRYHIAIHTGESLNECHVCFKKIQASHFHKHMQIHTDERPHICHICDKRYVQRVTLEEHLLSHTGEKRHECNICSKRFVHRSSLRNHKYIHNSTKRFICEKCGKGFNFKRMFDEHGCMKPSLHSFCKICNKTFAHQCSFYRHMRIHTGEKNHQCNICLKRFIQKGNLNSHMKSHEADSKKSNKNNLRSYLSQFTDKSYGCDICDKVFTTKKYLESHKKNHNNKFSDLNELSNEIIFNEKSMDNALGLQVEVIYGGTEEHINTYVDEKQEFLENYKKRKPATYNRTMRFICDLCNLRFPDETMLENHKLTHITDMSGHEYNSNGTQDLEKLKNDIRVDDPIYCQKCNFKFINKLSLDIHMETHTTLEGKEKNKNNETYKTKNLSIETYFTCNICNKKFINQLSLDKHIPSHANEEDDDVELVCTSFEGNKEKIEEEPEKIEILQGTKVIERIKINQNKMPIQKLPVANLTTSDISPMKLILLKIEPDKTDLPKNKKSTQSIGDHTEEKYVLAIVQNSEKQKITSTSTDEINLVKKDKSTENLLNASFIPLSDNTKTNVITVPVGQRLYNNLLPKNDSVQVANNILLLPKIGSPSFTNKVPIPKLPCYNDQKFYKKTNNTDKISERVPKRFDKVPVLSETVPILSEKVLKLIEVLPNVNTRSTELSKTVVKLSKTEEITSEINRNSKKAKTEISGGEENVVKSGMRYVCNICYKIFTQKDLLQDHMITHTDLDVFECSVCLKIFCHENALRVHKLIHSNNNNLRQEYTYM